MVLIKFNSFGQRLWGTYYGGEGPDTISSITIGADGNIYILGTSGSSSVNASTYNITTPGCYQPQPAGAQDAFIVKFTPGGERIWGTYYGGAANERATPNSICTDAWSNVYIVLSADAPGLPTLLPIQQAFGGQGDGVIAKFDSAGNYEWGSYYGGSNDDITAGCTADDKGNVYFCGSTTSLNNIATQGSFLPVNTNSNSSGFLVRVDTTGPVTVKSLSSDERIMIYPNPVTEILSMESSSAGNGFLYSIDGKELMSFSLSKGKNDIAIPQQLSPGVYFISCRLANGELLNQTIVYRK